MIDDAKSVPINVGETTPYTLPELGNGRHEIVATAYDYAGNKRSASATLTIGAALPVNEEPTEPAKPSKPLTDRFLDVVEKTEEQVRAILPKPVNDAIDALSQTVRELRSNAALQEIIDEIIEPVSTSALILTTLGLAATTTTLEITNLLYLLFRFGYFWLIPISFGKRKRPWGVIFDSTTGRQVRGAIVRIFSKEFNKLKESQITDDQGRFGFLVDIGEYYLTVTRPGFMFPSRILTTPVISRYEHIYRGESFEVKERVEGAININVPLDPEDLEISKIRMSWIKILNIIGLILEKINLPLLIGGTLMSWVTLVLRPTLGNYLILAIYGMLILLKFLHTKHVQRSWGSVQDAKTAQPVELAVIRIYNMASGAIMGTKITNREGKFTALVPPGQYYLMVLKVGYQSFQSQPILVSKQQGLIQVSVMLIPEHRSPVQPPSVTPPRTSAHVSSMAAIQRPKQEPQISERNT
ncbi:MAG: hypothetical protein UY52_C0023G0011 [Parcubacteria group bacterium GW2011_GWC2_49_9]|nr:MAG: hypothetical protein UY52_C0023G0011 [Parcubacteria group bacterium GW2011_GWC2_49_9]